MSTAPPSTSSQQAIAPYRRSNQWLVILRGLAGGIVGGVAGYFIFYLLRQQGFYGIMIPGALLGLCAGLCSGGRSQGLGLLCLVMAIGLTLFTEWHVLFSKNHTFQFFIANIHTLPSVKLVMMGLGALAAYWFGQGR